MIFNQAEYDSLDAIPAAYPTTSPRDEFENVGGKWRLKADAIPGAGDLFNPGIAQNRDRALDQVKDKGREIDDLKKQVKDLGDKSNIPVGSVVLSPEDAKTWQKVTQLVTQAGSVKAIETAVTELPKLQKQIADDANAKAVSELAKGLGINTEVLTDWLNDPVGGKGLSLFLKDAQVEDPKTKQPVAVKVGYLKIETENNGKIEVTERPLMEVAKEKLPLWKYTALTTAPAAADANNQNNPNAAAATGGAGSIQQPLIAGVILPTTGSASAAGSGAGGGSNNTKTKAQEFQAERDKVPSPFDPPAAK